MTRRSLVNGTTAPPRGERVRSLSDLKGIQQALVEQARRAQQEAAERAAQERERARQRNLFQNAVGQVQRLPETGKLVLRGQPPAPVARQQAADEAAALREALSDEVDISRLLDTDERLSFRRRGVGTDVTEKLRRGVWAIQAQIDLHGLRTDEARDALATFVREAHTQGQRCVRVVHGKGLGSPGRTPVLKDKVHKWLVQRNEVVAFVQAPPAQGGAGALVVLLQPLSIR